MPDRYVRIQDCPKTVSVLCPNPPEPIGDSLVSCLVDHREVCSECGGRGWVPVGEPINDLVSQQLMLDVIEAVVSEVTGDEN